MTIWRFDGAMRSYYGVAARKGSQITFNVVDERMDNSMHVMPWGGYFEQDVASVCLRWCVKRKNPHACLVVTRRSPRLIAGGV